MSSSSICDSDTCSFFVSLSAIAAILSCLALLVFAYIMIHEPKLQKDNSLRLISASCVVVFVKCLLEAIIGINVDKFMKNDLILGLAIGLAYASLIWNILLGQLVNYVINHQLFMLSNKVSFRSYDNRIENQTKLYMLYGGILTIIVCVAWVLLEHFYDRYEFDTNDDDDSYHKKDIRVILTLQSNIPVVLGIIYLIYILYNFRDVDKSVEVVAGGVLKKAGGKKRGKNVTKRTNKDVAKQEELKKTCLVLLIYPIYFIFCELLADIGIIISVAAPNTPLSENWGYMSAFYLVCRIPYHSQGIVDLILFFELPVVAKRLKIGKYKKKNDTKNEVIDNNNNNNETSLFSNFFNSYWSKSKSKNRDHIIILESIATDEIELRESKLDLGGDQENGEARIMKTSSRKRDVEEEKEVEMEIQEDEMEEKETDILGAIDKTNSHTSDDHNNQGVPSQNFDNPIINRNRSDSVL